MNRTLQDTIDVFKALGDETRLRILKLIASTGNNLCVGFIAHVLKLSQPAVSQHLKVLKNAYLVEANRQGYHTHYKIKTEGFQICHIHTDAFLETLGIIVDVGNQCELKGKFEECRKINS